MKRKKMLIASLAVLYFFSNAFIVDEFMRPWELTTPDLKPTQKYKYAVVLGGMIWYDKRQDKPQFMRGADRLFQVLPLLGKKQVQKLIITGGSGSVLHPEDREADILKKYLLRSGFPDSSIIVENRSRNTYENALYTKHLMDSLQVNEPVLFVTSAFHLRRAMACFEKAGVKNMVPFPTDRYSGPRKYEFDHLFVPDPEAMLEWQVLLHELMGYAIYKVKGYC